MSTFEFQLKYRDVTMHKQDKTGSQERDKCFIEIKCLINCIPAWVLNFFPQINKCKQYVKKPVTPVLLSQVRHSVDP